MDHPSYNLKVTGSNPVPATNLSQSMSTLFLGCRERVRHSSGHQVFSLIFHGSIGLTSQHFPAYWQSIVRYGHV